MDRAEVVAALREAYEKGGMSMLSAIADDIREHGQLHDPEFAVCADCGIEFEPLPNPDANYRIRAVRCDTCRFAHLAENSRRSQAKRSERRRMEKCNHVWTGTHKDTPCQNCGLSLGDYQSQLEEPEEDE